MQAALPPKPPAFERRILGGESASRVLRDWCAARGLPALTSRRVRSAAKSAPEPVLVALKAQPGEVVRYRRVTLACGATVLSQADNWYRPSSLTAEMNRRLETTDTPFGIVARPLAFTRHTVFSQTSPGRKCRIAALLVTARGAPFSFVVEDYRRGLCSARSP